MKLIGWQIGLFKDEHETIHDLVLYGRMGDDGLEHSKGESGEGEVVSVEETEKGLQEALVHLDQSNEHLSFVTRH